MCWFPRKPWRLRIERDGFEHVIRCGECPGCLEFERRRLADRLQNKYAPVGQIGSRGFSKPEKAGAIPARRSKAMRRVRGRPATAAGAAGAAPAATPLYLIRIWAPLSAQAKIGRDLHRRRGLELEPGLYRLGASSFGLLSREKIALPRVLRAAGATFRIEPVRFGRRRRAWRAITAGLMVVRAVYGEQVKRWYSRGLPPARRESWNVLKRPYQPGYDRARAPRAWTKGQLVLVPPEIWSLRRSDRRSLRALLNRAPDPESVNRMMGLVNTVVEARKLLPPVHLPSSNASTAELVRAWFAKHGKDVGARAPSDLTAPDLHPSSGGEGYVSSEHSPGELLPRALTAEQLLEPGPSGRPRWMERQGADERHLAAVNEGRKQRNRQSLAAALASLREKITG